MSEHRPGPTEDQVERLARYRAGAMSASERQAFEREAVTDGAFMDALYAEQLLSPAPETAAAPEHVARRVPFRAPRVRWFLPAVVAAAAAGVVLALLTTTRPPLPEGPDGATLRGSAGSVHASAARPIEPAGSLPAPPGVYRWSREPSAAHYRVEIFDTEGRLVASGVVRDTLATAAALGAPPMAAGAWRVVAVRSDGAELPAMPPAVFHTPGR